jgi:hypothetical protein
MLALVDHACTMTMNQQQQQQLYAEMCQQLQQHQQERAYSVVGREATGGVNGIRPREGDEARKHASETDGEMSEDEGVSGSAPNGSWRPAPSSWVGKRPRAAETSSSKAAALKACKEKARRSKINTR